MKMTKQEKKVGKVMKEYKEGTLHSGKKGPVVKSRKQAVAIALSQAGMSKPMRKTAGRGR
jgi:ribosomal protein L21E